MRANTFTAILAKTGFVASILLLGSGASFGQSINLTAGPTQAGLPDGQTVPMWGYSCGAVVSGSTATCAASNPNAGANWSPVVITVPYIGPATSLTINLTNNLSFGTAPNTVPTSLVIVGQLGGGLGSTPTRTVSPPHTAQGPTWPASADPTVNCTTTSAGDAAAAGENCPPGQADRVQSFATEVAAAGATLTTGQVASGSALTWSNLKPGTYLIHSGTHPSIQSPMGLYGMLVVTTAPVASPAARGIAYPGVNYDADVSLLLSEIDPVQNAAVAAAVATTGFSETKPWSGQPGQCGDLPPSATSVAAQANTCYPPAVNYDPRYYLINGVAFDRTNVPGSLFTPSAATGAVLVRFVNAGLRMHVPSIVGALTGGPSSGFSPPPPISQGVSLMAEDGNVLPGIPKVQAQVFLAAGKTYDVLMNASAAALPVYDRSLSLSTNNSRDGGMQGYIGATAPTTVGTALNATAKSYYCVSGVTLDVTDPAKGLLAGAAGANGAALGTTFGGAVNATNLSFQSNGTFTYTPPASGSCTGTFSYLVNGTLSLTATITQCDASTPGCSALGGAPTAVADGYTSKVASRLLISPPGVLANDTDPSKLPLTAAISGVPAGGTVTLNADGSFTAVPTCAPPCAVTFQYNAVNSQKMASTSAATVTVTFPAPSNLAVNVLDAKTKLAISDYRWMIQEDRTFYVDPMCQINTSATRLDSRGQPCAPLPVESIAYSFHTANMPIVATGCVGATSCEAGQTLINPDTQAHDPAACDIGNGVCRTDAGQKVAVLPGQVVLDPAKRYYISVLPGDGVNPVMGGAGGPSQVNPSCDPNTTTCAMRQFDIALDCGPYTSPPAGAWEVAGPGAMCGHVMGGAQVAAGQTAPVNIYLQQTPLPTSKIAAFVFQDDFPLNGENDAGGGVDIIAPNEPGLGGFEIKLFDQAGALGDATGQITYDMFNMPVSNALAGYKDPISGQDACPIAKKSDGIVGTVPTCPKFMADGVTPSPLAGQVIIANLYPGLYEVVATPAADRIARGEEWLQTNTLDGTKPHEAFIKPNEPGYFQEFGPGGYHVAIGFANPKTINDRRTNTAGTGMCDPKPNGGGRVCTSTLNGQITATRMSRTPDQRVYSSGSYDAYSFTQCYVSLGAADEADFWLAKCNPDGTFQMTGIPTGDYKLTVFDQWNELIVDGLVSPVTVDGSTITKEFPVSQWRSNLYTRTFLDQNGDGVSQPDEPGLPLAPTNIRYRDGSIGFFNNTDLDGYAGFNEVFPFMNWLVAETDTTRYKVTGVHVVYDAGGPADGSPSCSATSPCGTATIGTGLANTVEKVSLPANLRVPGSRYCANADCPAGDNTGGSTGRVDPAWVGATQGWQGLLGQNSFIEWAMAPFAPGENGGIKGHVIYASTRPFDDPALLLQLSWEPGVPHVTINLYQEGTALDGTKSLKLVDHTITSSFDDWAQGFRSDGVPNMNCPGQDSTSPFFQTLKDSKQWLDPANPKTALPNNSQFKCFDGWAMLNQIQPAPYDGMYRFPSVTGINPATAQPAGSNCDPTVCTTNPDGTKQLPPGKYVVEVIVPPGFELVKEEDKNILLGDVYIAPITQQLAGLGNIFIMPDQAAINAYYNKNNKINPTTNLGAAARHEGDTGSVEVFWPCVGTMRIVPDFNSLFPTSGQNAPFAGAMRPLCDRKAVTLEDQHTALAKFYVFTSTHIAGSFTGTITNDYASEFDPFSPQFGEKFGPPNLPVAFRDFAGNEMGRVYSDQWGVYNGMNYSSYAVNPPNPTGYIPQMMIACMNDPGPIAAPVCAAPGVPQGCVAAQTNPPIMITDPSYNPAYSNFCYEWSMMPGTTAYMDTPVIPTQAFADGYNLPDTEYPDATPAIKSVTGSSGVAGPWVSAAGATLTITALGDKIVQNPNFAGPNNATAPYNQKTITRHYGFGAQGTGPTAGTVTIAGVNAPVVSWSDTQIVVTVPTISATLNTATGVGSTCYNGTSTTIPAGQTPSQRGAPNTNYRCGQLVVTAANGKRSIDAITVTVAGKPPTVVSPSTTVVPGPFGRISPSPLQTAIDNATPGDLIIVTPGTYKENLIMWKPVRLQGAGAGSVTINADAHPAGTMDPWRRQVVCLFGLTLNGVQNPGNTAFDPTGTYSCPTTMYLRADRNPTEGFVGWDAASNGNIAQMLQEPTLMGSYEGAGITVVGRGIRIPTGSNDFWGQPAQGGAGAGAFPDGSTYLTNSTANCSTAGGVGRDYGTGNFLCNPSRIDGVSVINSSQGGGGIFMHGWQHYMEVANNRITNNQGTLSGGINVGNGETPILFTNDGTICNSGVTPAPLCPPIPGGTPANAAIPFRLNINVHVHHNAISSNASLGDALFSGTPAGAGGITFNAGADNYLFDHNWVAGNLSSSDGAGVLHMGVTFNGRMANNWVLFNQTINPTLPTNGGGIAVIGANSDRTLPNGDECGTTTDVDCPPGIGDGTGPGLVIDGNLIMGNSAESGSGGGLRLQQVNGTEVATFPILNARWYDITVTNNVIANNLAGWDGAGVSIQDSLKVSFVNNTVASNDTTASAGVLFKTLGAINASSPPPGCTPSPDPTTPQNPLCLIHDAEHGPQPAGLVSIVHTPNLTDSLPGLVVCPPGYGYGSSLAQRTNGLCRSLSMPNLANDMFWQNRAFRVDIVGPGTGNQSQQNLVAMSPLLNQTVTGECVTGANFWDVGVRGDASPTDHSGGGSLTLSNSILTSTSGGYDVAPNSGNLAPSGSPVRAQYCNGARVPPESCANQLDQATCKGFNAPPGRSETTGLSPVFVFNGITPAATVDEGNNWLNVTFGPLSLGRPNVATPTAPELMVAAASVGATGGAYSVAGTSPAVNRGTNTGAPATDFFGQPRPRTTGNPADIGAVEFQAAAGSTLVVVNPAPLLFSNVVVSTGNTTRDLVVSNNGTTAFNTLAVAVTAPFSRVTTGSFTGLPPNCGTTVAAGASCTIRVQWTAPATVTTASGTATVTGSAPVTNSPVTITANTAAATFTATVSPNPLAFGNWATGTTSAAMNLTVSNTGNSPLAGLAFGFGAATVNFTRVNTGAFPANAPNCGATLAVGALCTVKVTYAPGGVGSVSRNLTVTATGATIATSPVVLTGTGVAAHATAAVAPNPKTIILLSPDVSVSGSLTVTDVVSLTNTAPPGGAQLSVTNVAVTQPAGTATQYLFSIGPLSGPDTCTGRAVAPGQSCTVTVRFTNILAPRGPNRAGTITFTDNGTTATQSGALIGVATP